MAEARGLAEQGFPGPDSSRARTASQWACTRGAWRAPRLQSRASRCCRRSRPRRRLRTGTRPRWPCGPREPGLSLAARGCRLLTVFLRAARPAVSAFERVRARSQKPRAPRAGASVGHRQAPRGCCDATARGRAAPLRVPRALCGAGCRRDACRDSGLVSRRLCACNVSRRRRPRQLAVRVREDRVCPCGPVACHA